MRPGHLRWRRHWKAPIAFVLLVGTLLVAGAGIRVRPVVSAGGALPPREPIQNITNDVDLFDSSLVHRIDVQIDPEDRARMLEAYREDNDKIVVPATVTIDGVEIPGAGIRLKGNSSLWGVSDGGDFGGPDGDGEFVGGPGGGDWEAFDAAFNECMDDQGLGDIFGGFGPPSDGAEGFDPNELPDGAVVMNPEDLPEGAIVMGPDGELPEDGFDGGFEGGFDGFPQTLHSATGDDFAAPYLIVINHTNDQLRYQGLSQIALRTDGNGTILAEPVTIAAYEKAGIPAPQTALAGLSINGDDELLYGVTSVLDQEYVDRHFGGADGALFKATALQSQTFAYEGEDQSKYDGFEQVTAKNRHDKASLIDLLRFTQDATADEFAAGLADRVDIQALARLLAINNLLVNTDSLGTGPGGNYYLFNNATDDTIVPLGWDFNYSLGGLDGFNAQHDADPLGGGFFGGGFEEDGFGDGGFGVDEEGIDGGVPAGEDDIDAAFAYCDRKAAEATGMEDVIFGGPGGAIGDDGEEFLDENGDPIEGDPFGGANRLVERFMEVPEFAQAYEDARAELSETLFGRSFVAEELARQIAVVNDALTDRPSLAPEDALTTQNESLTRFVDERADHLGA
jgi:spore coat protein CotH